MTDLFNDPNKDDEKILDGNKANEDTIDPAKLEEYKSRGVDELAKGKAHADQFIEFLKQQNEQLREDLTKQTNAASLVEDLKRARQEEKDTEGKEGPTGPGLSPEDIESLVANAMKKMTTEQSRSTNQEQVETELRRRLGDGAKQFIVDRAVELGMSVNSLREMAQQSPQAFFKVTGIDAPERKSPPPTHGTVNTEVINNGMTGAQEGSFKYYQELRKKDKATYYSPKVQSQMFKDRVRLGDDFYK